MKGDVMASPALAGATGAAPAILTCAACSGENLAGSRFCRHCGAALIASAATAADNVAAPVAAAAPLAATTAPEVADAMPPDDPPRAAEPLSEIDQRHARKLLDRALLLSERGDLAGAILACRQSVHLAPTSAPGYSMLGLLLERKGDYPNAIKAYEQVVKLAPNSMLERESLQRLRAEVTSAAGATAFHFDDSELFDDAMPEAPDEVVPAPHIAPPAVPPTEPARVVPGAAMSGAAATVRPSPPANSPAGAAPARGRARPAATIPGAAIPAATVAGQPLPTAPGVAALDFGGTEPAPGLWPAMVSRPSFYLVCVPLMVATVMSVSFLAWVRNWSAAGEAKAQDSALNSPPKVTIADSAPGQDETTTAATAPGAGNGGDNSPAVAANGQRINGDTTAPVSNAPATAPAPRTPEGTRTARNFTPERSPRVAAPRRAAPVFPAPNPVAPRAPEASPRVSALPRTENADLAGMPRPRLMRPGTSTPTVVRVTPPTSSLGSTVPSGNDADGASAGGMMRSSGSQLQGYIRVSPYRADPGAAPPRPTNQAREAERAASTDVRAGRPAIANMSRAIDRDPSGGDTAFRYQSRAALWMESAQRSSGEDARRDYARAADDFQTAIAAYRDRIQRGERVAEARLGLSASLSGLRVAEAGMRR